MIQNDGFWPRSLGFTSLPCWQAVSVFSGSAFIPFDWTFIKIKRTADLTKGHILFSSHISRVSLSRSLDTWSYEGSGNARELFVFCVFFSSRVSCFGKTVTTIMWIASEINDKQPIRSCRYVRLVWCSLRMACSLVNMHTSVESSHKMETSLDQTAALCGCDRVCVYLCPHTWQSERLPWLRSQGYPQCTVAGRPGPPSPGGPRLRITWEGPGVEPGALLSLSPSVPSFLSFLRRCGRALHRTANKIRLRGGPHPAGSSSVYVCVWSRLWLLKIVVGETILKPALCVWERAGKRETPKIIAYPIFPQL